ncbi:hypothetical protein BDV96DRAFT_169298 [Lophiotrema nucula]|uniref:Uncharacterized protein n=1 Tax=Lophiotrema nucula TaxID=690887 RepID=A0A6A5YY84_9PLEO|nr:hypothetical protein BDV96DRAFT_169298 [Lophiotrema nucula]
MRAITQPFPVIIPVRPFPILPGAHLYVGPKWSQFGATAHCEALHVFGKHSRTIDTLVCSSFTLHVGSISAPNHVFVTSSRAHISNHCTRQAPKRLVSSFLLILYSAGFARSVAGSVCQVPGALSALDAVLVWVSPVWEHFCGLSGRTRAVS